MLEAEERLPGTTDSKGAKDNKDSKGNSTIEARRDCITRRQLQSNVDRTGLWWSAWAPIADCQTCQGGPCDLAFPWQWTGTWRVSGDWRDDGWDAVREAINNDGGKNFGYRWEKSSSTGGEGRCQAAGSQTVRLWHQVRVGWADIAQRTIVSSSNCPWQRQNGDWQFSHLDLLLEGGEAHHVGCSYDDRAECSRPRD
ncbi:hypothetical protein CC85DRAFT_282370 [Cutaneotrichosporon oleaginosum]|uniref:Uncharacterized protein n=1 Tax=Cutaneotrichosporon oleaginosum TaxID=879819 RepID=A0A0J1BCI8_9TREE|nr:uncharacterized protein CC85DRAFT_282370 [Cutaneotrichosporon oleaginosum]KLT45739.1 hypothetical protein CC85DRAFT_282370 [Cutaneotrichosporon oleaginosum]TXT04494.1 hypothetical protein COLE_07313 [Cutaneotrichosporon oleaginosum]